MPTADRPACSTLSVGFEYFMGQPVMGQVLLPAASFTEPISPGGASRLARLCSRASSCVLGLLKVITRENVCCVVLFCFYKKKKKRHTMKLIILLR